MITPEKIAELKSLPPCGGCGTLAIHRCDTSEDLLIVVPSLSGKVIIEDFRESFIYIPRHRKWIQYGFDWDELVYNDDDINICFQEGITELPCARGVTLEYNNDRMQYEVKLSGLDIPPFRLDLRSQSELLRDILVREWMKSRGL
jgi:hypothetical protein